MKNGDLLGVGVLVGVLYVLAKHQPVTQPVVSTKPKQDIPASTVVTTPKTTIAVNEPYSSAGGGGGGAYSLGDRENTGGDLRIYGSGSMDIFDMLDLWARSSSQDETYRQQYPEPPSVIVVPNEQ